MCCERGTQLCVNFKAPFFEKVHYRRLFCSEERGIPISVVKGEGRGKERGRGKESTRTKNFRNSTFCFDVPYRGRTFPLFQTHQKTSSASPPPPPPLSLPPQSPPLHSEAAIVPLYPTVPLLPSSPRGTTAVAPSPSMAGEVLAPPPPPLPSSLLLSNQG